MDEEHGLRDYNTTHQVHDHIEENESDPIRRDVNGVGLFVSIPQNEDLAFRAVAKNDIDTVQRLLDGGYDINTQHEENLDGPFFIIHDFSRMIRQVCLRNYTMLHVAVVHASIDVIAYLISKGADVNLSDMNKISPLSLSAAIQRSDVAQVLIDAGADVDIQSASGRTPLIEAVANGCLPVINSLIRAGCDLDLADLKDSTPLFTCLSSRNHSTKIDVLRCLIEGGVTVDHANKQGATALMLAVGIGLRDAATVLLEAGADINMSDKKGKTLIHLATGPNMVMYLLNRGAVADSPDNKGVRPLDRAVSMGHIGLMRVLIGADSQRKYSLIDEPSVIQIRQQVPAFDRWLLEEFGSPRQLKRLCRQVIRESLGPTNMIKISDLPIPSLLKDFLLIKHLDQSL